MTVALKYNEKDQLAQDSREVFADTLVSNPLLISAVGANLIAGACVSLSNAVMLTVFMFALLPLVGYLTASESRNISHSRRPAIYCLITSAIVFELYLIFLVILPDSMGDLGIFAPIVAFDAFVLARTAEDAPILTRREAVYEGAACALSFSAIALPVAFVREIIGNGSFFGMYLGFSGADCIKLPFAGFILCGIAIAVYRVVAARFGGRADS